jgi:7-carboxy-7-deazaguanine synthase
MDDRTMHETTPTAAATGYVSEMFSSIQGEGLLVGELHLFLRMAGCHATCYWCDTVPSKEQRETCVIHGTSRRTLPNPLAADDVVAELLELRRRTQPQRVSITGGEPLEQPDFVAEIAGRLRRESISIYLETSGLEVAAIKKVRPLADVIAMDIKLPSATGKPHWETHAEFLRWVIGKEVFVKIVVDSTTPFEEIETAIELIGGIDRRVPLVLQPESGTYLKEARGREARIELRDLLGRAHRRALEQLDVVRVIPQCHKLMRVR